MNEYEIERKLVEGVEDLGGLCLKLAITGRRGWPDRTVIFPHWIGFVELKRKGGKLSKQQQDWIAELRELGFECEVLEGIEDVEDYLERL